MRASAKVGLVGAGYVAAVLVAAGFVAIYVASTSGPDRQTYAAMYDFGDSLLFLAVFAVVALFPSAAALYFLRPYPAPWRVLSVVALAMAASGLAAAIDYRAQPAVEAGSILGVLSALAPLRILAAPLFALTFLLTAVLAPNRSARMRLFLAIAVEALVFASWFHPFRPY